MIVIICFILFPRSPAGSNVTEAVITYSPPKSPDDKLELKYPYGFEMACIGPSGKMPLTWVEGTAKQITGDDVIVEFPNCGSGLKPSMVRYCWRTDPCTFKMCPVYSSPANPSPPFIMEFE